MRNIRIGVDVGGTFTHAVAVDNETLEILGHKVVPTSHKAEAGVAQGIVEAFSSLYREMADNKLVFLAHSTTQATNALLEGDVAKAGIIGLAKGVEAVKAKNDMNVGSIELSPGKFLDSELFLLNPDADDYTDALKKILEGLADKGIKTVVAAEGFSVDDPRGENNILEACAELGIPACATHEMSGLYGLRVRTRTAVLNASILPKMIQTALMTEKAIEENGSGAPLMIMRSDGGVMNLAEVRKRPVMTLLSGPAAGIAACLMFLKASDALFLEVGGTSTDICLIKDGRAAVRSAVIGGHPTYLRTLDSRTLGIAGGFMAGRDGNNVRIGPRSAHLAGFKYCAFANGNLAGNKLKISEVAPLPGDPLYLVCENETGERFALTSTCAANLLGYIKPGDYAAGNIEDIRAAFEAAAAFIGINGDDPAKELARRLMKAAAEKVIPTLKQLMADYKMEGRHLKLIGGGGGAGAIVPCVAEIMGMPCEIANHAEVISAIGAALAMVRDSVEKNIVNPSEEDLKKIRAEAEQSVVKMGADPETVEVTVEIDAQKNIVRATAVGNVEFSSEGAEKKDVSDEERLEALKEAAPGADSYECLGATGYYHIYTSSKVSKMLFGLLKRKAKTVFVADSRGSVRLQVPGGIAIKGSAANALAELKKIIDDHTSYGDAGALIPALHIVAGRKIIDLTTLASSEQVLALAREEMSGAQGDVFYIVHPAV